MITQLEPSTKIILKVIFVLLALAFLWAIRDILLLLVLALILASAMEPLAGYLNKKRVPRAVSVLAVYISVFGLIALVIYLLIPPAIVQVRLLSERWPQYAGGLERILPAQLVNPDSIAELTRSLFTSGSGGILSRTFGVFSGIFSFITVLVISFYLVANEKSMKSFISILLPEKHHEFTLGLLEKVQKKMGMWVLGQIILSLSIFVLTYVGLSILKVDYALFLALLAGLLEVVPYIGPFLSAVPAVFFAFIQNPPLALAVAILYLIVQKTEGYVLVPKVMEKTVGTSPLVVLVALLVGLKLAGIVGLLIAVPLASAITVVVNEFSAAKSS